MSSSPSSVKQRSPKRTSPRRTPLQQQSASQANEISSRLGKESRTEETLNIYNANPFPTKPSQVLLPSTLRKKKSFGPSPLSDTFGFLSDSDAGTSSVSRSSRGSQPTVRLKRSVKALRDLYESQAEDTSRPSTATSPPLRPSTASSLRLRSISSSESLSGRYAWESLHQISNDDLALLPTLPSGGHAVKRISSRNSFTSIAEDATVTSSPNYNVLGATSSPRPPAFKDLNRPLLEAFEDPPSTSSAEDSSSSPNVVRLAHTSSTEEFQSTDQSSSPNLVRLAHTSSTEQFGDSDPVSSPNVLKLGTSSPEHSPATARKAPSNYSLRSRSSSSISLGKRKRSDTVGGRSFAERIGARNPLASSPPTDRYIDTSAMGTSSPVNPGLPSSAPQSIQQSSVVDESSPVVRVLGRDDPSSDNSSIAETHSSLQAALSSSPPRIQYPIVRAPPPSQHIGISIPKRISRSMSTEGSAPRFSSTLSAVPSEGSWSKSRPISEISELSSAPDLDEYLNSDDLAPASMYIINESANQTQIHLVPDPRPETATGSQCDCDCECDHHSIDPHHHEASDEVSALPRSEYAYRSPPLRPVRSGSHLGGSSSGTNSAQQSTARLNSMRSFTQLRQNSFLRPSSSSSSIISAAQVPSWARRYYSGMYTDSFHYLYPSGSYLSLRSLAARQAPIPVSTLTPTPSRPETTKSNGNPSFRNIHQSMSDRLGDLIHPKRPKLAARKSHILPGVGPLVSNPATKLLSPPPSVAHAFAHGARRQSYQQPRIYELPAGQHGRAVSMPLPPLDPRAHWAGIVEIHEQPHEDGRGSSYTIHHHSYTYSGSGSDSQNQSVIYHPWGNELRRSWHRWSSSPHLHHDARLNTGSSVSRGFGFPFNSKARWTTGVPELTTNDGDKPGSMFHLDLRSVQVLAFTTGFLIPLTWFIAAFLPLPKRPESFGDIEKHVLRESRQQRRQSQAQRQSYPPQQSRTQSIRDSQIQHPSQDPDWESGSLDVLAKLRLERHHAGVTELMFQNARWWRNLNRWMCLVGVVVITLAVVLAIIGTRSNWG
ncbi:hypothetical protein PV04_04107 [Phialophora macrospora]|uniref:Serine-rich protein n=1 Tax=Phialophora macrospora TaxID=1851006 RepID=A0A0D2FNG8_9EURO|nr:hypothetical protein PV04_04107 [Phialophora macrospora]